MRHLLIILIILLTACNSRPSDSHVEQKANRIVQQLDSNSLSTFLEWNFYTRGGDSWQKISENNVRFTCIYSATEDTTFLTIYQVDEFVLDFPCSFSFDTANYWEFTLKRYKDNFVDIMGVDSFGRDITLKTGENLNSLFPQTNPFDKISSLEKLKDSLDVIGITLHLAKSGYFIEFILTRQHILTYLPDNVELYDIWQKEFSHGRTIKKNWNYRKLEGQLDNG